MIRKKTEVVPETPQLRTNVLASLYRLLSTLCPGVVEPVELVDNGDQTHTVNYVPTREGPYSINVLYADEEIPRRLAPPQLPPPPPAFIFSFCV